MEDKQERSAVARKLEERLTYIKCDLERIEADVVVMEDTLDTQFRLQGNTVVGGDFWQLLLNFKRTTENMRLYHTLMLKHYQDLKTRL